TNTCTLQACTLRAHGNLPASDFAGSGDREAHMGGIASKGDQGRRPRLQQSPPTPETGRGTRSPRNRGNVVRAWQSGTYAITETWEAELADRRARPQEDPGDESDARATAAILCELGRAYPSRSRKLTCFRLRWF